MILNGKSAIITGAGGGIGRASAIRFAAAGALLTLTDIDADAGRETLEIVHKTGARARFFQADISDKEKIAALFSIHLEHFETLDILINNAGIEGPAGLIHQTEESEWTKLLAVNQSALFFCLQEALKVFLAQKTGGVIVNTSSVAGVGQAAGMAAYGATKHAVVGLTRSAAVEYARHGIRVNAVCPGIIDTAMTRRGQESMPGMLDRVINNIPMRRFGKADEIAAAILFLASQESSYMTGQTLVVDGGMRA